MVDFACSLAGGIVLVVDAGLAILKRFDFDRGVMCILRFVATIDRIEVVIHRDDLRSGFAERPCGT